MRSVSFFICSLTTRSFGVFLLAVSLLPHRAFAAGDYVGDVDAIAIGQGGAYIASPDSVSAFWYNPAALAGQRGLRLQIEGGYAISNTSFARAPNPSDGTTFDPVSATGAQVAAFIGVTYDFGIPDLAVGAAFWSPQSNHIVYPELGAQRYQSISSGNVVLHMHLAAAYRLFHIVSLGVTFGNTYFSTDQKLSVSASPGGNPEDPAFLIPLDVKVEDAFTITSNFGVRVEPTKWLAVGASVSPTYQVSADGTLGLTIPPALSGLTTSGNKISLQLNIPTIARFGVRVRPIERLALEAAFVYEGWSSFQTVTLTPHVNISYPLLNVNNVPVPQIKLPRNYKDAYSVRLGGEMKILPFLTGRLGVNVETSATQPQYYDVSTPDGLKFMASAGVSVRVWKFWIDAAYAHIFSPTVNVTNSKVALTNLAPVQGAPTAIVGNGKNDFSYDLIHLGVRANFFDEPKLASASEPSTTPAP